MILEIDDWKFEIDMTATMEYSAAEAAEHCTCGYCRNFYAAVDNTYPQLRPFLAQFGIDIEAPDELIPYFPPTECVAYYAVGGSIICKGKEPLLADGLNLFPELPEQALVNTFIEGPRFFLHTGLMSLPWVLDEPMDDVISPANKPSFVRGMMDKLMRLFPKDPFSS